MKLKDYYYLTKPGIIRGNAITTIGGFLLASRGHVHPLLFLATLIGISLVIAASCVFNNVMDRRIDRMMARTKNRALVTGLISPTNALIYGSLLGLIGFSLLICFTNLVTVLVALTGVIFYVLLYGYSKRRSVYGTLVGSVSGAVPIVVGYTAVTGRFDLGASLLFLILVLWQMPHFYAIAIYRLRDYAAAGIPVLPVTSGIRAAKLQMITYIAWFLVATNLLTLFKYTGFTYAIVMLGLGLYWFKLCLDGFKKTTDDPIWARKLFRFSLIVIASFSFMISVSVFLP